MLRGVLGGFLTGAILSGLVLVAVSVMTGMPRRPPPEASGVDVPAGSAFDRPREDRAADLPAVDDTPGERDTPKVTAPEPDDLRSLDAADTAPAAQPEAGEAETALNVPSDQTDSAGVDFEGDEPVLPSPQALAPEAPDAGGGADMSIATEPAQPTQPETEEDSGMFPGSDPDGDDAGGAPEAQSEATTAAEEGARAEESSAAETGEEDAGSDNAAPAEATDPESDPAGTIGDIATGVTTDRLPTVAAGAEADADDPPPLRKFAVPFKNPEGKPLMSIVLIDQGGSPISHEALADFPYPISYAVDADGPGAAETSRKYRAAGLEVLAMVDLPPGATGADTEVTLQAALDAVPGAVAVMEGTETGLQDSRAAAEQLVPILHDSGHGLVLFSEGLDTAQKLVAREGVPAVTVFRDFDAQGQNASAIRRFLDQAAFKAAQEQTGVVMVGRLRAETVSALLLWGLQDRANSVALAPVSAILRASKD